MAKVKDRVGEINYNKFGSKMEIIKYNTNKDIDVYFEEYNWTYHNTRYRDFEKGNIKCPYEPRYFNKGYIGEGKYNSKNLKCYNSWCNMLRRCYSEDYQNKKPTYIGCEVCEEWLNFQNFAKWFEENYYEIKGERMSLDKDILIKGNKIYSPNRCILIPERINTLFTKRQNNRGNYPIGITEGKNNLMVYCNTYKNNQCCIGRFKINQVEEAFQCYKQFKEKVIKQVADDYYSKGLIPKKLYDAMYRYEVEITD